MKHFSDFNEDVAFEGKKMPIEQVLEREIEVIGFKIRPSRYAHGPDGTYLNLQIRLNGDLYVIFTGSSVLCSQLTKYANQLPFISVIKKIGTYYTLT